jgi:hypothetical protein
MRHKVRTFKREINNLDKAIFCQEHKHGEDAKSVN